jgi:hypothetical protein
MSFKLFIYYCALCGGWAAFLTWAVAQGSGLRGLSPLWLRAALIGGMFGMLVAGAVGLVDALLNAVGAQRLLRIATCMALGLFAGMLCGLIGDLLRALTVRFLPEWLAVVPITLGWVAAGVLIGGSIGAFDLARAAATGQDPRASLKKVFNGVLGGFLGGLLGGLPFAVLAAAGDRYFPRSGLTVGLVVFGTCIGLLIGLAQVVLKEAWVRVVSGFRAGRELMLTKDETVIGRAEGCDLGLFGDAAVEKRHAAIRLKNNRYLLCPLGEGVATYLNGRPVTGPTPLASGDEVRLGRSVLEFGERQKRK